MVMTNAAGFCEHCGAPLDADARFCEVCGQPVVFPAGPTGGGISSAPSPAQEPSRHRWGKILIGGGAVLVVFALTIVVLFWYKGPAKAPAPKNQAQVLQKDKGQEPAKADQKKTLPTSVPPAPGPKVLRGEGIVYAWQGWLYYLPAVGQQPRKLVEGRDPALSPDGRLVVYMMDKGAAILDLASGQSRVISSEWGLGPPLVWSPTGDSLAFVIGTNGREFRQHLYVMGVDGSGKREITSEKFIHAPAWSADGKSLFFHDIFTLYQVSVSGEILTKTPLSAIGGEPNAFTSTDRFVPSPTDPNLAAFTQAMPGTLLFQKTFQEPNTMLFVYNFQQKKYQRLTPTNLLATSPVWSKDGRFLYFGGFYDHEHGDQDRFRLYRIAPDGTGLIATGLRLENSDWAW